MLCVAGAWASVDSSMASFAGVWHWGWEGVEAASAKAGLMERQWHGKGGCCALLGHWCGGGSLQELDGGLGECGDTAGSRALLDFGTGDGVWKP